MLIGVPKEIKSHEYRVGLTPASVRELTARGHAVLQPGAATPKLIDRALLGRMRPGAVLVDVSIDQGGCCATSRPTTHAEPTFVVAGIVHYCVANMPGAVPRTATLALNNATLPCVIALADKGWRQAMRDDPHLCAGLNVDRGEITGSIERESQGAIQHPHQRSMAGVFCLDCGRPEKRGDRRLPLKEF